MKKILLTTILITLSLVVSAKENIRFGMEASYPPFEMVDANNQIQGFDVDLAKALCKEIKATCTFTNQSFDSLIPSLRFKRLDAVISGMDITLERSKQVDFSQSYYVNSANFITQKEKISDFSTLTGKKIGVQNGTTHQKFLARKHPKMIIVPYSSYQSAILDLKSGRLDAVFGDTAAVNDWLRKNPQLAIFGEKITDPEYFGAGLGIAVRKNNKELLKRLNRALETIKKNGTYQKIHEKWFNGK